MPDQTPAPLSDDEFRVWAEIGARVVVDLPDPPELLAARAEIAALRNDLGAKGSDFDAACHHLGEARARIAELEQAATLAASCRAPEIHDRPTDADLARVVRALEGTGDAVYVLGSEVIELRARVVELEAAVTEARDFINQRPEYITACRNAHPDNAADYHRWQGGAEARRQLAERLGWTVPYEPGEKTAPKEVSGE